jgi:methanogenic corrinoid protein MtbC1
LNWLNVLLGDAPALELRQRYYQRLLALDYHEAGEIVAEALKQGSVEQLYTDVLMPALSLAERDRHAGELAESQRQFIYQTVREAVEELGERARTPEEAAAEGANPKAVRVWCVPAEDDADEIAGTMLAQILTARGYTAEAVPSGTVSEELLERVAEDAADAVLISAVAPGGVTHARRLCRLVRPKRPRLVIIVGLWNATGPLEQSEARLKAAGADRIVTKLEDGLKALEPPGEPDHAPDAEKLEPAGASR